MPVALQRQLSTREVMRRLSRANQKNNTAPSRTAAQRVVIRLDPDVATPEEELYLLGALEALKQQHERVQIVYAYHNKEIGPAVRNRWFLKDQAWCSCDRFFDMLVGTDFGVTISEPDPLEAHQAEEEGYERDYRRRLADVQSRQAAAQQAGVKDLVIPEPEHYFYARWHKTNGYFWQVSEALGLVSTTPSEPIPPFGGFSKDVTQEIWRSLQKAKLLTKPTVVFDFAGEAQILPMMEALGQGLPGYELLSLQELKRVIPGDIVSLAAALSHDNCRYAVCPLGSMSTAAWAGGVPNILLFYSGANSQWDAVHPVNVFTISRDRMSDDQMPEAILHGLSFLVDKAARKGTR